MSIPVRRHHRERMRRRNALRYPAWPRARMFGETPCRCGRRCCNNPRKHGDGPSFAEVRQSPVNCDAE